MNMAILEVLPFPNPFLRHEASRVKTFDSQLKETAHDMCKTMHEYDGVGLAATQVGIDAQLLILSSYVFMSPEERKIASATGDMGEDIIIINPEVVEQSEKEEVDLEGCLSFPDVFIKVSRPLWVKIKAYTVDGDVFTLEGNGFGSRAILHEMDHLNGKVMTDHLNYLSRKKALAKHQRIQKIRANQSTQEETANDQKSSGNDDIDAPKGTRVALSKQSKSSVKSTKNKPKKSSKSNQRKKKKR